MKKLLFAIIFLSCYSTSFSQNELNLTEKEKDTAWEFIAQRFFPQGFYVNNHPAKFYSNVNYLIKNGTSEDSLFLKNVIKKIDLLIPCKVSYVSESKNANFIIEFIDPEKATNIFHRTEVDSKDGYYNNVIKNQNYRLAVPKDTPLFKRQEILQYVAVTGLTDVGFITSRYIHSNFLQQQKSIFYPRKYRLNLSEDYPGFQPIDKFYLAKLYDPKLDEKLGDYIKSSYGYWYYLNFKLDEDLVSLAKGFILFLVFFFVIAVTFKPIITKQYKRPWINYMTNGIFAGGLTLFLFFIFIYLKVYDKDNLFLNHPSNIPTFRALLVALLIVESISIPFAFSLFLLDKYLLGENQNIFLRALIRLFNFSIIAGIGILLFFVYEPTTSFWNLALSLAFFFIFGLARSIFLYFKDRNEAVIREKDVQLSQLSASKAQAEVASLHARINPHFLYNSLNSIAGLAHVDADKTERMALSLSDLFRHNLNRKDETYSSIQEEIEAVKAYLEIEQIRFANRLQFTIEVDESLNELQIPRNIIQPLIENAVKHGISALEGQGILKLEIIQNQDAVEISVYDNGPAFPEGIVSGYGLQSIFDILELSYKDNAALQWESEPKKRIWISIHKNELMTTKQRPDAI